MSDVIQHPTRTIGLYMISLQNGERSFTYWRDKSAARTLADDPKALRQAINSADVIYFSGITIAILEAGGRERFFEVLQHARAVGKSVVFDPNIRPRLWPSSDALREGIMRAAGLSTLVLPSYDDEHIHFGDADPDAAAIRYLRAGATEAVVKNGAGDVLFATDERREVFCTDVVANPVDTTGAGDSFNGEYLAARLQGAAPDDAIHAGQRLARAVIMTRGALLAKLIDHDG